MNQKKKDVLQAVKEGCRTSVQISIATGIDRDYCTHILHELEKEGYVEMYEKRSKFGVADGGNKYRALESRYMRTKREQEPPPPMDPLVAALFGRAHE